jgi:hypothetical protein
MPDVIWKLAFVNYNICRFHFCGNI